jgi:hypothetical protein
MALLTRVTGAAYPTSGAATTATTGFSNMANNNSVHVGSTDIPPGGTSNGFIRGPADASSDLEFSIGPSTELFGANETNHWTSFWARLTTTGSALPADGTQVFFANCQNGGSIIRILGHVRNLTHNPGMSFSVQEFLTGGTLEGLSSHSGSGQGSPFVYFNRWFHFCMMRCRSTAGGENALYINGQLIARQSALPTDTELTGAVMRSQRSIWYPGVSGLRLDISGPFETYDGTGPSLRPLHSLNNAGPLTQWHGTDVGTDSQSNGKFWTYSVSGATRTPTVYASSGSNPNRKRNVYSGAAASTWSQTTIDNVGTLPFNDFGWATLCFPMIYVPNGTAQIVIRNAAGSAVVTLDYASSALSQAGVTKAPLDMADRYALMVHLSSGGTIKGSLYDLTELNTAQNAWSFDLGTWTPAQIGTITISGVLGANNQEVDGMAVAKYATIAGVDSLSHVMASTVTPSMAMVENVAASLAPLDDSIGVPDGPYPNRTWGQERRAVLVVVGRAGATRAAFQTNVMNFLTEARGLEVVNVDGGSVNDIASVTSTATQQTVLASLTANVTTMANQCAVMGSLCWLTTMINRPVNITWTTLQVETMAAYTVVLRGLKASLQGVGLHIRFSDPASLISDHSTLFSGADETHFTATGNGTYAKQMILGLETPAYTAVRVRRGIGVFASAELARKRGKQDDEDIIALLNEMDSGD